MAFCLVGILSVGILSFHRKMHQPWLFAGLRNPLQLCSWAARKWRENEEMKRKLRENEEMEREENGKKREKGRRGRSRK